MTRGGAGAGACRAPAARLARRLAAFVYEGVLLFGVRDHRRLVYSTLTQQRHALQGQTGLQVFVFVVLGALLRHFWSRGGQTRRDAGLAPARWSTRHGRPPSPPRAAARYLASWLWFAPALLTAHVAGLHSAPQIFALLAVGVVAYALLARLHPQRQFLHDALCGTRLVTLAADAGAAGTIADA